MESQSVKQSFQRLRELDAQLDEQLKAYTGGEKPGGESKTGPAPFRQWIARLLLVALFLLLPFYLLIRVSLLGYTAYQLNGWVSLLGGAAVTVALLLAYGVFLTFRFSGSVKPHRYLVRGVVGLVLAYCCYGLLYMSSYNVKSEEIRSYYRTLHPILRVTVTTASLADPDLVVTDLQRSPEDYREMGLAPRRESLHYEQPTGYVHAVDLRTVGKSEWKNRLMQGLFNLLGFRTLRHVGTADHLHVSLPLND